MLWLLCLIVIDLLIDRLVGLYDAYILCSVAGDLRMHEVVSIGCVYKGLMDVDHVTLFALGRHA